MRTRPAAGCYRAAELSRTLQSGFGVRNEATVTRIQLDLFFTPDLARAVRAGLLWTMHGIGLGLWSFTQDEAPEHQRIKPVERFAQDTFTLIERFGDV